MLIGYNAMFKIFGKMLEKKYNFDLSYAVQGVTNSTLYTRI